MPRAPAILQRRTMRVALVVLGVVVVLSLAELTSERFKAFTQDHSLIGTFAAEAVLLVGVYLVIDEIIERRETRRWSDVMSLGIRALSVRADALAGVVRRAVDELDPDAESADAALESPVDHGELDSRRADELGERLRADDSRARSFARELRQSATRLEEAIIQWGPTLVEDAEAAELLNLLPDVVDSARRAADAVGAAGGWADDDRQLFSDSLVDVLKNGNEFPATGRAARGFVGRSATDDFGLRAGSYAITPVGPRDASKGRF